MSGVNVDRGLRRRLRDHPPIVGQRRFGRNDESHHRRTPFGRRKEKRVNPFLFVLTLSSKLLIGLVMRHVKKG